MAGTETEAAIAELKRALWHAGTDLTAEQIVDVILNHPSEVLDEAITMLIAQSD
jgi:hypothetical protein